jgi:coniferyl-aldehyde dehydrogenase
MSIRDSGIWSNAARAKSAEAAEHDREAAKRNAEDGKGKECIESPEGFRCYTGDPEDPAGCIRGIIEKQRAVNGPAPYPSAADRRDRIDRCIDVLVRRADDIADTVREDFGRRPEIETLLTEVWTSVDLLKNARRNLRRWMRPDTRHIRPMLRILSHKGYVTYRPKGVVGIISPWNFPVNLAFGPLASVLAAGNSAVIKPSELTPRTAAFMKEMIASVFDESEVAVVTGGPETGKAFASAPFDHLIFTGSPSVGKAVMRSAAANLTPVTLELGGKSPVIIGRSADLETAVDRILRTKLLNAGQICLAPDYVLLPEEDLEDFRDAAQRWAAEYADALPEGGTGTDIISEKHADRIRGYVIEAREKGFEVIDLGRDQELTDSRTAAGRSAADLRTVQASLILEPSDELKVMREEIFGPVLPVKSYTYLPEAVDYVTARPRPLALYYFGRNRREMRRVLRETISGGVTTNHTLVHVGYPDLPLGGVGMSGTGRYHGRDGFREFSHHRTVYRQGIFDPFSLLRPPYTGRHRRMVKRLIRR